MKKKITFNASGEQPKYYYSGSNVLILESNFSITKKHRFSKATLNITSKIGANPITVYLDKSGNITDYTTLDQNPNAIKLDVITRTYSTNKFNLLRAFYELSKQAEIPSTQRFIVVGNDIQQPSPSYYLTLEYDLKRDAGRKKVLLPFQTENVSGGINLAEKSLEFEIVDTIGTGRLPINVKHVYNSRFTSDYDKVILDNGTIKNLFYCAGYGFKLNYQQYLIVDSAKTGTLSDGESSAQYIWVDAMGDLVRFYKNATTNEITCEQNFKLTASGENYEISDLSNNRLTFSPSNDSEVYNLTKITDFNGNFLTLNYSENKLTSIVRNSANKVEIEYDYDSGVISLIRETVNGTTTNVTFGVNGDFCIEEVYFAKNGNQLSNKNVFLRYIATEDNEYYPYAVYETNGIGYYFDCSFGEYEELHLLSTTGGIKNGLVQELTSTPSNHVTVNGKTYPIISLYDIDYGERLARVVNERTKENMLYTFDYFGNLISAIEENYNVSGTKTPQAKSFTKTGKYLDVTVERELNLAEYLSSSEKPQSSTTDFTQFDSDDLFAMNHFKVALESQPDSNKNIYYSDDDHITFIIKDQNLSSALIDASTTGLAVSAWVKADSLPIEPIASSLQVNDQGDYFYYNNKIENLIDIIREGKRFDLCVKVFFDNNQDEKIFINSFDWTRKDFQYCETFVILTNDEVYHVKEIQVSVNYAKNNGRLYLYGGAMINGKFSLSYRNEKKQTIYQESSNGKLSTLYLYLNDKVIKEETFTKNYNKDSDDQRILTVENSYAYDNKGNLTKITDKNNLITEYAYSNFGDVISTKICDPVPVNFNWERLEILNEVVYNEIGDVQEVKNEFGEIIGTYTYAHNAVSKITDFNNCETVFSYDPTYSLLTSVESTVSGVNNKNSTEYTSGMPVKDTDVASNDTSGNTTIEYDYDGFGNVTAIYVNGSLYCSIKYENDFNRKIVTYANGDILIYNQDVDNGVEFSRYYTRNPNNRGSTEFEMKFDSFGRFKDLETEDFGGTKIAQKYNDDGTTRKSYVECEDDIFYDLSRETEYGDDNKISKQTIRHKDGNSEYIVDELKLSYDDNDVLTEINHKDVFREGLDYDRLNRVTDTAKYTIIKDENEQPIATGGFVKKYGYKTVNNKTSQLISQEQFVKVDEQGNETIEETLKYVYDTLGRIIEVWKTVDETETLIKKYTYDSLSRLVREDNGDIGTTYTYSYDNAGNILSTYSYPFTTENLNGVTGLCVNSFTYTNGKLSECHGSTSETNIPYDANGNPTSYLYFPMTWSHGHRLETYKNLSFKYNYAGLRTQKIETSDGLQRITKFALEGDKIIAQENPDGTTILFYYGLDGLTALEYDGNMYYYKKNIFGDIIGIYDSQRNIVARYQYDAWGNCRIVNEAGSPTALASEIAALNPFRYRGYYLDSETGLYYLNARYYNPKRGRFISPDDISYLDPTTINGLNLYAYCNNNPVMYSDPSGHFGIGLTLLIATVIGLAVGFGVEAGKQAYNGGNWNWDLTTWNWWEIGKASLIGAAAGFAYGLGGVAGGIVKGSFQALAIAGKALTVSQSVGLLLGTAAVTNFAAGVAGYAMHTAGSETENFNILKGISEGVGQTGEGLLSFFTAGMYVGSGFWKVGVGAKNTLPSMLGRSAGRFIANYVPNYLFENLF